MQLYRFRRSFSRKYNAKRQITVLHRWIVRLSTGVIGGLIFLERAASLPIAAQSVSPDQTLSTPSTVTRQGADWVVTDGSRSGNYLFHSFDELSVPTGSSLYFNQDPAINTIFSRVTGSLGSNIDGLIRANGASNLFLLNPNGIIFGPNARLDIGGAFIATTANRFDFGNGLTFGANGLDAPPLLTINRPVGLQFGRQAAPVDVNTSTFNIASDRALVLLGGEVTLSGATITNPSGRIELGSVGENQAVTLNPATFSLDYTEANEFQDILINRRSWLDVSGNGGGDITIQGETIKLRGSKLLSINQDTEPSGTLHLQAEEAIVLRGGLDRDRPERLLENGYAMIYSDVADEGMGGNITLQAQTLTLVDQSLILSATNGEVSIDTLFSTVSEATPDEDPNIIAQVFPATGNAGDVTIAVGTLEIDNRRQDSTLFSFNDQRFGRDSNIGMAGVFSSAYGQGRPGRVFVQADRIDMAQASISTATYGLGINASRSPSRSTVARLVVDSPIVNLLEGSQILSLTLGDGASERVRVEAEQIEASGIFEIRPALPFPAGIISATERGQGRAEQVTINTSVLRVLGGARLIAFTAGRADAAGMVINADEIEIAGDFGTKFSEIDPGLGPAESRISTAVADDGNGSNAGPLTISADTIRLEDGGALVSGATGLGNGATLTIEANHVEVRGRSRLNEPSKITSSSTNPDSSFDAGNIVIRADQLRLEDGGEISVSNASGGNAGTIDLTVGQLVLDDGGLTTAENFTGNGGNIWVNNANIISLTDASRITTTALESADGGNIRLQTQVLHVDESSLIEADAQQGNGGRVDISTAGLFVGGRVEDRITAETAVKTRFDDGIVEFNGAEVNPLADVAKLPETLVEPSSWLAAGCDPSDRFAHVGRGGIPLGPSTPLLPEVNWSTIESTLDSSSQVISEASRWQTDPDSGIVQLAVDEHSPDSIAPIQSLIQTGITLRKQGQYGRSLIPLHRALQALRDYPEPSLQAIALMEMGLSTWLAGESEDAIALLNQSLSIAKSQRLDPLLSDIYVSLGHIAQSQTQYENAHEYYQQAADTAPDDLALVRALMGQLDGVIARHNQPPNLTHAQNLVTTIPPLLRHLDPSSTSLEAQLHFASTLLHAQQQGIPLAPPNTIRDIFQVSLQQAEALENTQALTYSLGYLGHLYEQMGQWEAAQTLTEKALFVVQNMTAPELSYQWHWQLGRILNAQWQESRGQSPQFKTAALSAYDNAIQSLQTLRSDLIAVNTDVQFDFRDQVEPVYREYTKLLVEAETSNSVPQNQLIKARQVIEALQLAEVDNFLGNSCLVAQPKAIDEIDTQAAVVYPIILGDRITTIVAAPGQPLQHHTVWVEEAELTRTVFNTVKRLSPVYAPTDHLSSAQTLYDWLVRPAVESGILSKTDTLTFVLDGPLRSLPMAVLHDGDRYLIEDYSIALSSGLQLLDPKPLEQVQWSGVVAGLSQSRGGFTPLPGVEQELANITQYIDTALLANEDFTKANITESVTQQSPNILHLATHGQFGSSFDDTFLLTWDGRLNANELNALLQKAEGDRSSPIEMLILSACQTAAGDRRAVLGLAGLALRSGARSTLATLWNVNDQSTAIFMDEFYRQLQQPGITKAEAIRNAQLALMATAQYSEPFYWAPFLLIGNWL